ncbi:MAG: hypothetical protein ACD_12C00887G0011 [uncultured bacterium]|nr:MAG: hypothetical protein ACD_12C00887G0011 [uncultured bacterium]
MTKIGRNETCPCGSGIKYKRCHYRRIFTHQSKRFTISVKHKDVFYKVLNLVFYQNKNTNKESIIISFPYHSNSKGLLSSITFPRNKKTVKKLSFIPGGKVTSHKIKYSYWEDGNTHFSQDGKIYTFKNKYLSDTLDNSIGHIFTIQFKGLKGFKIKEDIKKYTTKEIDLDIDLQNEAEDSIKITGWWYNSLVVHPQREEFKKVYILKQDEGFSSLCFPLEAPVGSQLSGKILFLCVRKEFMTKEKGTHLLFIGGFDKKIISNNINNDLHFLGMLYPARNYNDLKNKIGSVDLPLNNKNLSF